MTIYTSYRSIPATLLLLLGLGCPAFGDSTPTAITTELVAEGFTNPVLVTSPPDDPRLFIVDQISAKIWIIKNGQVLPTPFLDIDAKVSGTGERGLLGLAFHPNYSGNHWFYVNYTDNFGNTVIERYAASENPDVANPGSALPILGFDQPFGNHNGGMIAFSPVDGYLYIASGDGGGSNDPNNQGQQLNTLLGKLLRIDVNHGAAYEVPRSNPFNDNPDAAPEIWAYGLRNPWRFSFDRHTGDAWIGDVGQNAFEEVDFQPAASMGGENYGWKVAEGFACRGGEGECGTDPDFVPPLLDYGRTEGRSITGGYVYRGRAIPDLRGTYFFGDFVTSQIWSVAPGAQSPAAKTTLTDTLNPPGPATIGNVSSFGEDHAGEIYICDYSDGEIYRIVPVTPVADVNLDGQVNTLDKSALHDVLLERGTNNPGDPDLDNDGMTDAVDLQFFRLNTLEIAGI